MTTFAKEPVPSGAAAGVGPNENLLSASSPPAKLVNQLGKGRREAKTLSVGPLSRKLHAHPLQLNFNFPFCFLPSLACRVCLLGFCKLYFFLPNLRLRDAEKRNFGWVSVTRGRIFWQNVRLQLVGIIIVSWLPYDSSREFHKSWPKGRSAKINPKPKGFNNGANFHPLRFSWRTTTTRRRQNSWFEYKSWLSPTAVRGRKF